MALSYIYSGEAAALRRSAIEERIDHLIALLDDLDEDPDLEPANDEEPTLGWPEGRQGGVWNVEDGELEVEEDEPDLGSVGSCSYPEAMPQTMWSAGSLSDRERDVGDEGELDEEGGVKQTPLSNHRAG